MAEDRDDLPKHLEFIQAVIERHARTSFVLKGWSITVVASVYRAITRVASPGAVSIRAQVRHHLASRARIAVHDAQGAHVGEVQGTGAETTQWLPAVRGDGPDRLAPWRVQRRQQQRTMG